MFGPEGNQDSEGGVSCHTGAGGRMGAAEELKGGKPKQGRPEADLTGMPCGTGIWFMF